MNRLRASPRLGRRKTALEQANNFLGRSHTLGQPHEDSASALSVASGDNSVKVSAVGNSTGTVIAKIYDATPAASFAGTTPRLVNISVLSHSAL